MAIIASKGTPGPSGADATSLLSANRQTASYTLALTDKDLMVEMNTAAAGVLTVPANATVAFPVGAVTSVARWGAGTCTITPASGVTIRSVNSLLTIGHQYGAVSLRKVATDEWHLTGDVA